MTIKTWLTETFNLELPIIMAPMFLVSNIEMTLKAAEHGITGCIPALNYRTPEEFRKAMEELKSKLKGKSFGINLIVNKSNLQLKKQIEICCEYQPSYIITSLGSPEEIIKRCQPEGIKVIADVVDLSYAKKCENLGVDALIAVNSGAGGHAGPLASSILVPMLKKNTKLPIISAGGVGTGEGLLSVLALGAEGVSIGSPFIATTEAPVTEEYKMAIAKYGAKDIALTTKLSGTPCTVIKTPYVEKIGLSQNSIEAFLNKNRKLKKYAKMITAFKGMKSLEKAAFSATYKTVWCAGPSIEFIDRVESVGTIVHRLKTEYDQALQKLGSINA